MTPRPGLPVKAPQQCHLTADPWERQPAEPSAPWLLFQVYLDTAPPRRLVDVWRAAVSRGLVKDQKTPPAHLDRWAWQWRWADRASAWETAQAQAMAAARKTRLAQLEQKALEALEGAFETVLEGLAGPGQLDLAQSVQALPKLVKALEGMAQKPGPAVVVQVDLGKVLAEVYGQPQTPVLDVTDE